MVPDSVMPELQVALPHGPGAARRARRRARARARRRPQGAVQLQAGADDPALSRARGPRRSPRVTDGTPVLEIDSLPEPYDKPETWKGQTRSRVIVPSEELRGLVALHPEARDQPRRVARRVRAAERSAVSVMTLPSTAQPGGARQGRLRAPLRRLPRRRGRRQRPRRDVPRSRARATSRSALQVPHDAVGLAAHRRRSLSHGHARRALDGDAHVARAAREGPDRRDRLHQDVLDALEGREAGAADPDRRSAQAPRRSCWPAARRSTPRPSASQCHGDDGKGDGPSAGELRDDLKFPIRPADFTRGPVQGRRRGHRHLSAR